MSRDYEIWMVLAQWPQEVDTTKANQNSAETTREAQTRGMSTALYPFGCEQHQKASKVTSDQQELLKNVAKKPKKKQINGTVPLTWYLCFLFVFLQT